MTLPYNEFSITGLPDSNCPRGLPRKKSGGWIHRTLGWVIFISD